MEQVNVLSPLNILINHSPCHVRQEEVLYYHTYHNPVPSYSSSSLSSFDSHDRSNTKLFSPHFLRVKQNVIVDQAAPEESHFITWIVNFHGPFLPQDATYLINLTLTAPPNLT